MFCEKSTIKIYDKLGLILKLNCKNKILLKWMVKTKYFEKSIKKDEKQKKFGQTKYFKIALSYTQVNENES